MNDKETISVLVVDDEKIIRDFLKQFLSLNGIKVRVAEDSSKAIEITQKQEFDIIFLDMRIANADGFKLLKDLKSINPRARYVLMASCAVADDLLEEAKKEGATGVIEKPFRIEEIMSQINEIRRIKKIKYY